MDKRNFLIVGESGSGKSTFINYMFNYLENGEKDISNIFENPISMKLAIPTKNWSNNVVIDHHSETNIENQSRRQTSRCFAYDMRLDENKTLSFIDTPGFGDDIMNNNMSDNDLCESIVDICLRSEYLNGIILVINGTSSRLNSSIRSFIEYLKNLLPTNLLNRCIIVYTNCDESSCNFEKNSLDDLFDAPQEFYMQNNIFRWNKTSAQLSQKAKESYTQKWNESMGTIIKMLDSLVLMEEKIPTESLQQARDQLAGLFATIRDELTRIDSLVDNLDDIELQKRVIKENTNRMNANQVHEKTFIIDAIPIKKQIQPEEFLAQNEKLVPYYELYVPKQAEFFKNLLGDVHRELQLHNPNLFNDYHRNQITKLKVTLKDNEAISQYRYAKDQKMSAQEQLEELNRKVEEIKKAIEDCFETIKNQIDEVRNLKKRFNFTNYFSPILKEMQTKTRNKTESAIFLEYINRLKTLILESDVSRSSILHVYV